MTFRNILALGLLGVALVLCFIPLGPKTQTNPSTPEMKIERSKDLPSTPLVKSEGSISQPSSDWLSWVILHRKTAGFILVGIMVIMGIFLTKRFFDSL